MRCQIFLLGCEVLCHSSLFETGLRKRDGSANIWNRVDVVLSKQFYQKISRPPCKKVLPPLAFSSGCRPD